MDEQKTTDNSVLYKSYGTKQKKKQRPRARPTIGILARPTDARGPTLGASGSCREPPRIKRGAMKTKKRTKDFKRSTGIGMGQRGTHPSDATKQQDR